MRSPRFAIVDVETTHGDPRTARIMEVAVIQYDDGRETGRWSGLVRPRCRVSPFVQRITGITDDMFAGMPSFAMVASRLRHLVHDRILVAHNVRYDMTALQQEFARTGLSFGPATLCTERLARRFIPQLEHYNLASLCRHLGVEHQRHHRAAEDAMGTMGILEHLIQAHGLEQILSCVDPAASKAA